MLLSDASLYLRNRSSLGSGALPLVCTDRGTLSKIADAKGSLAVLPYLGNLLSSPHETTTATLPAKAAKAQL